MIPASRLVTEAANLIEKVITSKTWFDAVYYTDTLILLVKSDLELELDAELDAQTPRLRLKTLMQ